MRPNVFAWKISTLWRAAEVPSQKNFSSIVYTSLFLLYQWNATWNIKSIVAKYSVMGLNTGKQAELKKNTDAISFSSWWMAWVALQVHIQCCMKATLGSALLSPVFPIASCHSYNHLPFLFVLFCFHCDAFILLLLSALFLLLQSPFFWQSSQYLVPGSLVMGWLAPCSAALWSLKFCRL